MHIHNLEKWKTDHDFYTDQKFGEQRTKIVLYLTSITMIIEIIAGTIFGSMALLADGWHMATHVAAFGISVFAYHYARKNKNNPDFTFSTGKVSVLGGFSSAIALAVVALMMAIESVERFFSPHDIMFDEAIIVAIFGFFINVISVLVLHKKDAHKNNHSHDDHHDDHHSHDHHDDYHSHDHNLKSAYFHVLADALKVTAGLLVTIFCELRQGFHRGGLCFLQHRGRCSQFVVQ